MIGGLFIYLHDTSKDGGEERNSSCKNKTKKTMKYNNKTLVGLDE